MSVTVCAKVCRPQWPGRSSAHCPIARRNESLFFWARAWPGVLGLRDNGYTTPRDPNLLFVSEKILWLGSSRVVSAKYGQVRWYATFGVQKRIPLGFSH